MINREKNRELLKEIPYREFFDFAVIYRIAVKESWDGFSSMRVSNGLLEGYYQWSQKKITAQKAASILKIPRTQFYKLVQEAQRGEKLG